MTVKHMGRHMSTPQSTYILEPRDYGFEYPNRIGVINNIVEYIKPSKHSLLQLSSRVNKAIATRQLSSKFTDHKMRDRHLWKFGQLLID